MCGIAGFSISPDERIRNVRKLARDLLLGIEHRGREATGAAWYQPDGTIAVQKAPLSASHFVRKLSTWRKAPAAILHTRFPTQGDPNINANNHPIDHRLIVGVHNGSLYNEFSLEHKHDLCRYADVDSEVIFAMLSEYGMDTPGILNTLEELEGAIAIAWFDRGEKRQTLHLARVKSSPLVVAQTPAGSLFFASEFEAIEAATSRAGLGLTWVDSVGEGQYLAVREGKVVESHSFEVKKPYFYHTSSSSYTGKGWRSWAWDDDLLTDAELAEEEAQAEALTKELATPTTFALSALLDQDKSYEYERAKYPFEYEKRLDNVRTFYAGKADSDKFGAMTVRDHKQMWFADIRPGEWVQTLVAGQPVFAQVIHLPHSYPYGDYYLRARVKNSFKENGDYECVIFKRTAQEMTPLSDTTQQTNNAIEAARQRTKEFVERRTKELEEAS